MSVAHNWIPASVFLMSESRFSADGREFLMIEQFWESLSVLVDKPYWVFLKVFCTCVLIYIILNHKFHYLRFVTFDSTFLATTYFERVPFWWMILIIFDESSKKILFTIAIPIEWPCQWIYLQTMALPLNLWLICFRRIKPLCEIFLQSIYTSSVPSNDHYDLYFLSD